MTNRPGGETERARAEQEWRRQHPADTFSGEYRGTRPPPHGGAAHVHDSIGAEDLCWCGQPAGHMWPGKTVGAPHPREGNTMNTPVTKVDRRDLRAYHQRLQDFILKCVNEDRLTFRVAKNSTHLYPSDGTAKITVFARNTDRQMRQLQKWYLEHVYVEATGPADPEDVRRLAERHNDPAEHPRRKDTEETPMAAPEAAAGNWPSDNEVAVAPPIKQAEPEHSRSEERRVGKE